MGNSLSVPLSGFSTISLQGSLSLSARKGKVEKGEREPIPAQEFDALRALIKSFGECSPYRQI